MEKYARQALSEGVKSETELHVTEDSELYRVINVHYNRNNHIEVSLVNLLTINLVILLFCGYIDFLDLVKLGIFRNVQFCVILGTLGEGLSGIFLHLDVKEFPVSKKMKKSVMRSYETLF